MKKIKLLNYILIFILFISISIEVNSQSIKFRTTGVSLRFFEKDTKKWSDWSELQEIDFLISLDLEKDKRIKIHKTKKINFDIVELHKKQVDKYGNEFFLFNCIDDEDKYCSIILKISKSQDNQQLTIYYHELEILYQIFKLD